MADNGTLGKYELRREIGRGAMGVVFEAYDPMIKRVVALKTIRSDQLGGNLARSSPAFAARRRRRAGSATRTSSRSRLRRDGGVWYIAMEFVHGRELKEIFLEQRAPPFPTSCAS
jgi:serine/threonine-protein kinase